MRSRSLILPVVLAMLAASSSAQAQATKGGDDETKETKSADDATAGDAKTDEAAKEDAAPAAAKTEAPAEPAASPHDPKELSGKTYYFVGARWRQTLLPHFMLTPFVSGGPPSVWIPSFGIEGGMRKDGNDTIFYAQYSDWSMDPFGFKGKNEAPTAWEVVESRLKLIDLGVDMLWSTDIDPKFAFQYGIMAQLSIVLGDLKRVQGQPKPGGNPENADDIVPCPGVIARGLPNANYCTSDNDHYGDYTEPSWFNGGSKPNLYAGFGPQLAFRFKPVKEFVARVNLGWNIFAGPFFGLSANYGL